MAKPSDKKRKKAEKKVKKKEKTIQELTIERFRKGFDTFDSVVKESDQLIERFTNVARASGDQLKGVALFILARAAMTMRSIKRLALAGYEDDSTSLMRTVAELAVDLKYLNIDPAERVPLFQNHVHISNWRRYNQLKQFPGFVAAIKPEQIKELEKLYDNYKDDYPDKKSWTKRMPIDRAKDTDLLMIYELTYRMGCETLHSGPGALQTVIDAKRESLSSDPQPIDSLFTLLCAVLPFVSLMDTVRTIFGEVETEGVSRARMDTVITTFGMAEQAS